MQMLKLCHHTLLIVSTKVSPCCSAMMSHWYVHCSCHCLASTPCRGNTNLIRHTVPNCTMPCWSVLAGNIVHFYKPEWNWMQKIVALTQTAVARCAKPDVLKFTAKLKNHLRHISTEASVSWKKRLNSHNWKTFMWYNSVSNWGMNSPTKIHD